MKYLISFFLSLWMLTPLSGQWESMNGPYGGVILDLAQNDQHQFAATSNGLYRSADGGKNWIRRTFDPEINYSCNEIGINGNFLVVNAYQSFNDDHSIHYFKSADSGNSWQKMTIPEGIGGSQIEINDYGIYFKVLGNMWVSIDQGNSWSASNLPIDNSFMYHLFSYDGHIYTATENVIYKSDEDADDWTPITIDNIEEQIVSVHVFDSIMFVRTVEDGKLFRSTNHGETWSSISGIDWGYNNPSFIKNGNAFIGNGLSSLNITYDFGESWQSVVSDDYIEPLHMISLGDSILAGSFGLGILLSVDAGQTFNFSNEGLDAVYVSHISEDSNFVWATNAFGGVWKQNKLSGTWEYINSLPTHLIVIDIKTQGQNVFVLDENHQLHTSSDHGETWINITPTGTFYTNFTEITIDGPTVMVGGNVDGEYSVIRTTQDTGMAWDVLSILIDDELFYPALFTRTTNAIFASERERKFRSIDNGSTWEELYNGPFFDSECIHCSFMKIFSTGDMLFMLEMDTYFHSTRLHVSHDHGESWEIADFGYPETGFNGGFTSYETVGNNLIAIDVNYANRGILVSFDGGYTSTSFHEGLPTKKIFNVHSGDQYLYAGTAGFGIWRRKIDELLLLANRPSPSTKEIVLYPNPSRGHINLRLDSFTPGIATIIICDIQGNLIESREYFFEGHLEISTRSLPSGLYLLTLQTANELYTGKFFITE